MRWRLLCSFFGYALFASAPPNAEAKDRQTPISRRDTILLTETGTVKSIDVPKRELSLKGPLGETIALTVDTHLPHLGHIKPGDVVRADYYVSVAAEVRPPTAEEAKTPFVALDTEGTPPKGTAPIAGGLRRFRAVATIEGLERPTRTITIKGPRGNIVTARVVNPLNFGRMHIGDHVIITYTEALAIGLEKVSKRRLD